jgi:hypothetical protein
MRTVTLLCAVLVSGAVHAHGGGLDGNGCHTNRRTGDYHCHRAQAPAAYTERSTTPREQPGTPTCYTGPRGGTYTITPSGRKNYRGC